MREGRSYCEKDHLEDGCEKKYSQGGWNSLREKNHLIRGNHREKRDHFEEEEIIVRKNHWEDVKTSARKETIGRNLKKESKKICTHLFQFKLNTMYRVGTKDCSKQKAPFLF